MDKGKIVTVLKKKNKDSRTIDNISEMKMIDKRNIISFGKVQINKQITKGLYKVKK